MAELDGEQIVGARVDLVVHSMGGLVARNYASQPKYGSLRNRMQGQFHAIVTLNTPETGSLLAPFLIAKRDAKRKAPLWTPQGFIWDAVCGNATVAKCFDANGYPIRQRSLNGALGFFPIVIAAGQIQIALGREVGRTRNQVHGATRRVLAVQRSLRPA